MPAPAAASGSARDRPLYDDDDGPAPRIRRRTFHVTPVLAWRRAAHARSRRHQQLSSAIPTQKNLTAQLDWRDGRASKYDATDQAVAREDSPLASSRWKPAEASCYHDLMSRTGRKNVAWLCLGALLFLQLAVAAYACPAPTARGSSILAAVVVDVSPCQEMDQEHAKLCEQHCVHDSQSVDTQPHSAVNVPLLALLAVVVQTDAHFAIGPSVHGASSKVVDPPPLVRFGVLRI